MNPPQSLSPEMINQGLTQMKRSLSQIDGESHTMLIEAHTTIFQNFASICNQLVNEKLALEAKIKELGDTLDKIYQGHPEILIAMGKDAKPKK